MSHLLLVCPTCHSELKVKSESIGKRVRCPKCRATLETAQHLPVPEEPPPAPEPDPGPVPNFTLTEDHISPDGEELNRLAISHIQKPAHREPWYYRYASFFAQFVMVAGIVLMSLGLLGYGIMALPGLIVLGNEQAAAGGMAWILIVALWALAYALSAAVVVLLVVFWAAMTLILVDVGRNLRAVRAKMEA